MRRSILIALALVMLAVSNLCVSAASTFDKILASTVFITGEKTIMTPFGPMHGNYVCSGFLVSKDRVLTAGHCVGDNLHADGVTVSRVVKADDFYDLALLDVYSNKPWLKFRDRPVAVGQALIATGYAEGFDRASQFLVHPFLVDYSPNPEVPVGLFVQPAYIGGMSGGPVTDLNGLVVSIVQDGSDEGWGYGITASLIKAFLLGTK